MTEPNLPLFYEQWIFNRSQKQAWESFLLKQNLSEEIFADILSNFQLVSYFFGYPKTTSSHQKEPLVKHDPERLMEDEVAEVYLPSAPRVRHHLWVVLKRPVRSFLDVTEKEAAHMRKITHRILYSLRSTFGLSAVIAQWHEIQSHHFPNRWTMEIIPPFSHTDKSNHLWDKMESNSYVLFRDLFPFSLPPPNLAMKKIDAAFWKQELAQKPFFFSQSHQNEAIRSWILRASHIQSAAAKTLNNIHYLLETQGFALERVQKKTSFLSNYYLRPVTGCPFCSAKTIDSQSVFETDLSRIFYNFKPAVPQAHFLLIPKRHVTHTESLTEREVRDLHNLAQKLTSALKKQFKRSDIHMYTQNDSSVGQTVAHTHMHVLLTPQPLKYMLFSLNYFREKTLLPEEMKRVIDEIQRFF